MPTSQKLTTSWLYNLKEKINGGLNKYWPFLAPVMLVIYLLFGLVIYMVLQNDLNNFDWFMRNDAAVSIFVLYSVVGVVGFGLLLLFRRGTNLLGTSQKMLAACFVILILAGVCIFTFLTFTSTQTNYTWMHDGLIFQQMGQSFLANHEFIVDGAYVHHYGPIFPLYLAPFYAVLPVHLGTQVADEVAFLLAAFVVFIFTQKMYGTTPALTTTGLIATFPIYLFAASRNYAEPFVLIMFTITLYLILESLKPEREKRVILAGLTAGIGFLAKSSFGLFFVIAVGAAFLWRFYYVRWRALRNKNYILAVVIFLAVLLAWTARDVYHFWTGSLQSLLTTVSEPSDYMSSATNYTFSHLSYFFVVTLIFAMFAFFYLLGYSWFFADYLKGAIRRFREERISFLLLAVVLPLVIGLLITAVYFVYEDSIMPAYACYLAPAEVRYFFLSFGRYSFIVFVPLSWLAYELAKKRQTK